MGTLKFEFVQPGELDDPFYMFTYDEQEAAEIIFNNGEWVLGFIYSGYCFTSGAMLHIAAKLKQLNKATKSQRILGVF